MNTLRLILCLLMLGVLLPGTASASAATVVEKAALHRTATRHHHHFRYHSHYRSWRSRFYHHRHKVVRP